mmetsp:Transcript_6014/g.17495  ORF Transcript_6014/g.17495 Transcript_6014/m.17495 type:complete len:280 (+) Transcript_6014:426-1265(+)
MRARGGCALPPRAGRLRLRGARRLPHGWRVGGRARAASGATRPAGCRRDPGALSRLPSLLCPLDAARRRRRALPAHRRRRRHVGHQSVRPRGVAAARAREGVERARARRDQPRQPDWPVHERGGGCSRARVCGAGRARSARRRGLPGERLQRRTRAHRQAAERLPLLPARARAAAADEAAAGCESAARLDALHLEGLLWRVRAARRLLRPRWQLGRRRAVAARQARLHLPLLERRRPAGHGFGRLAAPARHALPRHVRRRERRHPRVAPRTRRHARRRA